MDVVDRLRVPGVDRRDPVGVRQLVYADKTADNEIERLRADRAALMAFAVTVDALMQGEAPAEIEDALSALPRGLLDEIEALGRLSDKEGEA